MAYDKAVDSAQLETALTATANAIREKAGNADACAWDASTGFASLIAAIQAGGGGGTILGHEFACGSFTLMEDTTGEYTVLTGDELFEAIKTDFPGSTKLTNNVYQKNGTSTNCLHFFLSAMCWIDTADSPTAKLPTKALLASFMYKAVLNNVSAITAYTDNYSNQSGTKANGIEIDAISGLTVTFSANRAGYAGRKYNWVVFPNDHGEVVL